LDVKVSSDNINFSKNICIGTNSSYHLRIFGSDFDDFSGYLEVKAKNPYTNGNSVITKWLWVENGKITLDDELGGLIAGRYEARFRIWTPGKEGDPLLYAKETLNSDLSTPWSDNVIVNINPLCN